MFYKFIYIGKIKIFLLSFIILTYFEGVLNTQINLQMSRALITCFDYINNFLEQFSAY